MFTGIAMAAAAVGGAVISADAARKAGNKQADATGRAIDVSQQQYDTTRSDTAPFRSAGVAAMDRLRAMSGIAPGANGPVTQNYAGSLVDSRNGAPAPNMELYGSDPGYRKAWDDFESAHKAWAGGHGFDASSDINTIEREVRARLPQASATPAATPSTEDAPLLRSFSVNDFWQDPVTQVGYDYGKDLGERTLKSMAPLSFGADSGAAVKEATKFGQDYAGSKAADSYSRFTNDQNSVYNKLMGFVSGGQVATGTTANAGATTAANNASMITAQGNAAAGSGIAQAGAYSGALNNLSNWWQQNQMMNRMFPRGFTPMNTTGMSAANASYLPW